MVQQTDLIHPPVYTINQCNVIMPQGQTIPWGHKMTGLDILHKRNFTGKGIKVAVIDTGVDFFHPDLAGASITVEKPEILNTSGEKFASTNGHGTAVAGVIAARSNQEGVVGAAPDCDILTIKALKESQGGSYESLAKAVSLAVNLKVDIINLSLGGPVPDMILTAEIDAALNAGILVVAAAGNTGRDDSVMFPGSHEGVFCVAASNQKGEVSPFSSRGWQVDVCAPGERVLTTYKDGTYSVMSGTSFAAPFVSGAFACLLQAGIRPTLQMIQETSEDIEEVGVDTKSGNGLIRPDKILEKYHIRDLHTTQKPLSSPRERIFAGVELIKKGVSLITDAVMEV